MKFIDKETIKIDRELSDLDTFTLEFVNILEKKLSMLLSVAM